MIVEVKKNVMKKVEEVVKMDIRKFWVVRVITGNIGALHNCVKEVEYDHAPDEQEIADALYPYDTKRHFATVEENYSFVEVEE